MVAQPVGPPGARRAAKHRVRKLVRRGLAWVNRYGHLETATVFPESNAHLVVYSAGTELHDTFFNAWDSIHLEPEVILGHQVMFLTGLHEHGEQGFSRAAGSRGPIRVGRGAFIGSRAVILGGVTIGVGAAVGAGSVVTKDVPAGELWAGNPARPIRSLI